MSTQNGVTMAAPELAIPAVRVLENLEEIAQFLIQTGRMTNREELSVLPDQPFDVTDLRSSWDSDLELLDRGVECRCIYPALAARRPDVMEYLAEFVARGAKVRVLGTTPGRMVVFDRSLAVVPETPGQPSGRALVVGGPQLVRGLCADFVRMWRVAWPVGVGPEPALSPEHVREVLVVLGDGVTDGVAARRLGISERTLRRRVSSVMGLLGATSRFDAGAKAATAGWI